MEKDKTNQNSNQSTNNNWNDIEKYYILTLKRSLWLSALIFLFQIILLIPILLMQNQNPNKIFYLCHTVIINILLIFILYLLNHRKIMFVALYKIDIKDNSLKCNNQLYYIFTFLLAIVFFILTTASYAIVKRISYLEALKITWWLSLLTMLWSLICLSLNHEICKYLIRENLGQNN